LPQLSIGQVRQRLRGGGSVALLQCALLTMYYDGRSKNIPATYWLTTLIQIRPEESAQLDHRLVMSAAHRLWVDAEGARDLRHVHFAIIQHPQNLALSRRQQ